MQKLVVALLLALGFAVPAYGQGTIVQSGPITAFHLPVFLSNGVVMDGGQTNAPAAGLLSMFNGPSCPFGIASSTGPGALTGQYAQLTICQTTTNTIFDINSYNGLASPGIEFIVNGVVYPFPGAGGGGGTGYTVASGNTDTISAASITGPLTVLWNSASSASKTEHLPPCNGSVAWNAVSVIDQYGSASQFPIVVVPNGAETIRGLSSWVMNQNYIANDFVCNSAGAWVVK